MKRFIIILLSIITFSTIAFAVDKLINAPSGNLILDANGNIVTNTNLDVSDYIKLSGSTSGETKGIGVSGDSTEVWHYLGPNGAQFRKPDDSANVATLTTSGLGIGGTPDARLHVYEAGDAQIYMEDTTQSANNKIWSMTLAGNAWSIRQRNDNGTTKLTTLVIDSDGDIGFGGIPSFDFDYTKTVSGGNVVANFQNDSPNANSNAYVRIASGNATSGDAILAYEAGSVWVHGVDNSDSDRFKIAQNVNGDFASNVHLTMNTSGHLFLPSLNTGAGTYALKWNTGTGEITYDTSSRRFKKNIRNSPYGIAAVVKMKSRMFEYKSTGNTDIGFIAEELNPVIPELVVKDSEGIPEGVVYDRLISVAIKAIQEQQELINQQKDEINFMKKWICKKEDAPNLLCEGVGQ